MSEELRTYAARPRTSIMAVIGLIASILGVTVVPTIGSIVGLILGYIARSRIRDSAGSMGGEGVAKASIIVGWIGVGLFIAGACLALASLAFTLGVAVPITICGNANNWFQ